MTEPTPSVPERRILLPRFVEAGYWISPFLLLIGGFLVLVMMRFFADGRQTPEFAIFQTWLGIILLATGALWLTTSVIVTCVRSIVESAVRELRR